MGLENRTNYYEILEVKSDAAQHEVTLAYDKAKHTYSSGNPALATIFSESEARELLRMIEEAFSVLGNRTLRQIYDQRLLSKKNAGVDLSYESLLVASRALFPEAKAPTARSQAKKDPVFEEEISGAQTWDGDFLKKIREYRGFTIEKMSEITKVNSYYLIAIENMDPSKLPAIVFVRGYVLQVAKTLGLNTKSVADSYMKIYNTRAHAG